MKLDTSVDRLQLVASAAERTQAKDAIAENIESLLEPSALLARVPPELAGLLTQVISAVASGATVSISTLPDELTTTVAARQLGVSRPTLMRMIRDGQIKSRLVGTHHRIKTRDVLEAKRLRLLAQRRAFEELRELEEELDQF
jgi:excisionase family DNA binding protein